MIKWDWFQWYKPSDLAKFEFDEIVVSWDTATKASELHDYSVAMVWGRWIELFLLLDLVRLRIDYPDLRRKAIELHHQTRMTWGNATTLVEDAGSGIGLVQDLRAEGIGAVPIKAGRRQGRTDGGPDCENRGRAGPSAPERGLARRSQE